MESDDEIRKLEEQYASLMQKRDELEIEMNRWVEERDRLNEAVRKIRASASEFKAQRDDVNRRIQELRAESQGLRDRVQEKNMELQELDQRLAEAKHGLSSDRRRLESRLRRLDWEVMTTPTREMMEKEEQVVKEIRDLRGQLAAHDDVEALEARRLELRTEIVALRITLRDLNEPVERLRTESKMNHEKLKEEARKIDEARLQADEAHKMFLEAKDRLRKVAAEAAEIQRRLRRLRDEIERGKRSRVKEEAIQTIREKLSKRGKLTFEEFRLLSEESQANQKKPN